MIPVQIDNKGRKLLVPSPCGLVEGPYGVWLLEYYKSENSRPPKSQEIKFSLNKMVEAFNSASYCNYSLGYGLTGLLWIIRCIQKLSGENFIIFYQDSVIPILEAECIRLIDTRNYDLFNGANGLMVYLMEINELPAKVYKWYVTSLTNNLEEELIPPSTSKVSSHKISKGINLGVPHGVAGCVLMLIRLYEYDPDIKCKEVLKESVKYLLGKRKENPIFPGQFTYSDHAESKIAPLAWCYGDLSMGYAILKAGKVIQNRELMAIGTSILDISTERNDFVNKDLSLCHGAPSIAYIYHKAWLLTDNEKYQEKSRYWVNKTKQLTKEHGQNKLNENFSMEAYFKNQSLIYGYPGMELALNTINGQITPEWDSWMML